MKRRGFIAWCAAVVSAAFVGQATACPTQKRHSAGTTLCEACILGRRHDRAVTRKKWLGKCYVYCGLGYLGAPGLMSLHIVGKHEIGNAPLEVYQMWEDEVLAEDWVLADAPWHGPIRDLLVQEDKMHIA